MATIPRSWTSRLLAACAALTLLAPGAQAGPFFSKRRAPEPEPEPVAPAPIPPVRSPLEAPLPRALGEVPAGLASASAQACNGCHYGTHDAWAASAHATGWRSEAFRVAVAEVGTPACTGCHQPLAAQQPALWTFDDARVDRPVLTANPAWDATLAVEGVTCAACHVVDGVVVGAEPPSPEAVAPHPVGWSAALGRSESCAACHQLAWPGAEGAPFYDTYGEWSRSPYAAAGVQCQDCHMGAGAAEQRLGADHGFAAAGGRAVSVLVSLPSPRLVRGAAPQQAEIVLQNTGAGHAWPTGTPFRGVRLTAALEGPDGARVELLAEDLRRELSEGPPWTPLADTRLPAAGQRAWPVEVAIPQDLPAGDWALRVVLTRTLRGAVDGAPVVERSIPLRVE